MLSNRFTVVLDANVLGPALPRNIALSLAAARLFRPKWSAEVLAEAGRYISRMTSIEEKGCMQMQRVEKAFPDGLVEISPAALSRLSLPDDKDRHVLAAAIKAKAQLIVTDNLKDFPEDTLSDFDLVAVSADHFFADTIELSLPKAMSAIRSMRGRLQNKERTAPMTDSELILGCEKSGLVETAALISREFY